MLSRKLEERNPSVASLQPYLLTQFLDALRHGETKSSAIAFCGLRNSIAVANELMHATFIRSMHRFENNFASFWGFGVNAV